MLEKVVLHCPPLKDKLYKFFESEVKRERFHPKAIATVAHDDKVRSCCIHAFMHSRSLTYMYVVDRSQKNISTACETYTGTR